MTYLEHGRRHRKGGTDEIPGIGVTVWPVEQDIPILSAARAESGFLYVDPSPPVVAIGGSVYNNYGGVVSNAGGSAGTSSRTAALDDYFIVCAQVGPSLATFWWNIGILRGPDFGQLGIAVASVPEDVPDLTTLTYLPYTGNMLDLYHATSEAQWASATFEMITTGGDGDPVTAVTNVAPFRFSVDGGSGLYAFKFSVTGKNASSSGYKIGVSQMSLQRAVLGWGL